MEMARAVKRFADQPLASLFGGPLTTHLKGLLRILCKVFFLCFYLIYSTESLTIFEIPLNLKIQ